MNPTTTTKYLTYQTAVKFLKEIGAPLSLNSLRNYVSRGTIPYHRLGTTSKVIFKTDELLSWIETGEKNGKK